MAKPKKKVAENKSETPPETNTFQDRLDQRISRRQAISRIGAAAIGIGAVVAAAAGGYYYVSTQGGQQRTTITSSAGPIRIDFFIWQYGVQMVQDNVARYNAAHPESNVVLSSVPQETYGDDVISRFSSAVPTDILYSDVNYQILFGLDSSRRGLFPGDYKVQGRYHARLPPWIP